MNNNHIELSLKYMMEIKLKQKSVSKPVISSKLPKAFSQVGMDKEEIKSPVKIEKKQTIKLSKVLKHLDKMPDQNTEKLFEPYSKLSNKISKLPYFPIYLEEMITLSQISSTSLASTVRKVLHSRSLTLFSIKQIPISTRKERNFLRIWMEKWQNFKDPIFVKVIETFWNIPEGCVSIVSEYCNAGSLNDLCKNVGAIPEKPLSQIAKILLQAAILINETDESFIGLSSTHILFNRDGQIKISPGFTKKLQQNDTETDSYCIGKVLLRAITDEILEIAQKNCCLFHSIEVNPITSRISSALKDFLCALTSFNNPTKLSDLLTHK